MTKFTFSKVLKIRNPVFDRILIFFSDFFWFFGPNFQTFDKSFLCLLHQNLVYTILSRMSAIREVFWSASLKPVSLLFWSSSAIFPTFRPFPLRFWSATNNANLLSKFFIDFSQCLAGWPIWSKFDFCNELVFTYWCATLQVCFGWCFILYFFW